MNKTKKFLTDGIILAASAVFMRTVSVSWNAYVSNTVGAEAMGLLSLVMSVYTLSVTFACSGVGFGVTRTVSEAIGRGDKMETRRALFVALLYAFIFGTAASGIVFSFADRIGTSLLGDTRTVKCVRVLALSMLPIALSAVLNGYFNAVRRVYKSASASIFEQLIRMSFCIMLFSVLLPKGVEWACMAIIAGGMLSEFASFLFSLCLCISDIFIHNRGRISKAELSFDKTSIKQLCAISLPIAASTYIRTTLVTVEHMLIPRALKKNGLTHAQALESYGMLGSMVLPLVLYPASLTGAFASLLIPEFSEAKARGDTGHIKRAANKAILVSFAFATLVSGVMISYSVQLGRIMYGSEDVGRYIRMLAPIIPIMYLDTVVDSMLKGLGYQVYTMTVNIIDAAISIVGVMLLIPRFGIVGYVILISVSEIINASASLYKLTEITEIDRSLFRTVVLPMVFCVFSCSFVRVIYSSVVYLSSESVFGLSVHIVSVVIIYSILTGAFCVLRGPLTRKHGQTQKALGII